MSICWHCCRPNLSMKTPQEKAMYLSRLVLRASYNGRYFHSLTLLARTDLSQQSYGSTTTAPFSYSDVTTFKSSARVYISYTLVLRCTYMNYIRSCPWVYIIYIHLSTEVQLTNTYYILPLPVLSTAMIYIYIYMQYVLLFIGFYNIPQVVC